MRLTYPMLLLCAMLATGLCVAGEMPAPAVPAAGADNPANTLPQFIIPKVELEIEAGKLAEAVGQLEKLSREADPAHHGVKLTLELPPQKPGEVTADGVVAATQAPFGEVLRLFCLVTDCGYRVAGDQIVIGPALDRASLWRTNPEAVAAQQKLMEAIVFPGISFMYANGPQIGKFLSKRSAELDADGHGIPISIRKSGLAQKPLPAGGTPAGPAWVEEIHVDLNLRRVSLADLMDYLVLVSSTDRATESGYVLTGYGIVWGVGAEAVPPHAADAKAVRAVEAKLATLIVPQVDFWDVGLEQVTSFMVKRSQELDPDSVGVNIVINLPWGATRNKMRAAKLRMDKVSLGTVLDATCKATGTTYRIMGNAVIISGPP